MGAAPGVGKTYAMLQRARLLRQEGVDVVVGLVETHARSDTEALTRGLEILPRRVVAYQDRQIEEFDLDGALRRRPKLIIVDELAHTNAPESRHPKRWQDVEELLDARIDVWTALNIQHLESLADVVSRITGVTVRETVPDIVLRDADDIVLVDITSEELIQRLKDGKVYLPGDGQARAAEVLHPAQSHGVARNRAASHGGAGRRPDGRAVAPERHRGSLGNRRAPAGLRRPGRAVDGRRARRQPPRHRPQRQLGRGDRRCAGTRATPPARTPSTSTTRCASRRASAPTSSRLVGHDLPAEILLYAQRENITQIVVGRSQAGFLVRLAGRSLSEALVRRAVLIGVHVVTGDKPRETTERWRPGADSGARSADRPARGGRLGRRGGRPRQIARSVAAAAQSVDDLPRSRCCSAPRASACAPRSSAGVLSFFAYDFFFIAPRYEFTVNEPHEFFALAIFLIAAILVGWLAGRARDQERLARESAQTTRSLFELSRKLSGAVALDDILQAATVYAQKTLNARCVAMLLPEDGDLVLSSAWPPIDALDPGETGAARWAFEKARGGGLEDRHLAERAFPVPPAGDDARRRRRLRLRAGRRRSLRFRRRSNTRSTSFSNRRRSPSIARSWSRPPCAPWRWKRTRSCARPCWPRCRTTCARRWRRSPAR